MFSIRIPGPTHEHVPLPGQQIQTPHGSRQVQMRVQGRILAAQCFPQPLRHNKGPTRSYARKCSWGAVRDISLHMQLAFFFKRLNSAQSGLEKNS